jgi:importin-5
MRSLAFVLLRRFLFLPPPQPLSTQVADIHLSRPTLYDHLSANSLFTLERLLLYSFEYEPVTSVRQAAVEAIMVLANHSMHKLGRPWPALCTQVVTMVKSQNATLRESAFG